MRYLAIAALAAAGVALVGCAATQTTTYVKKGVTRDDATIDVLDCHKAALVARRNVLANSAKRDAPETRRKAAVAARTSLDRCFASHGWKKKA